MLDCGGDTLMAIALPRLHLLNGNSVVVSAIFHRSHPSSKCLNNGTVFEIAHFIQTLFGFVQWFLLSS